MQIKRLLLTDFRSCAHVDLAPGPGITILSGANAQGKSTLLEAVYLLATSRSPRASKDVEMIRWGQEVALAAAEVAREERGEVRVEVSLSRSEKRAMRVNHVRRVRVADLVGHLNTVLFSAADIDVVRGEPSLRRRFLNLEIAQISPHYCHALVQYRRILEQRNRLLKLIRDDGRGADTLETWNEQLIAIGSRIVERRVAFVAELSALASHIHSEIAGASEQLSITYLPSFPIKPDEDVSTAFRQHLALLQRDEIARGATLAGPHRDDLSFLVSGTDVRVYGSQGQQRSVALATKLAEVELMQQRVGEAPVLLLDDAGSELDEARRARLYGLVTGGYQTLVACTDTSGLPAEIVCNAEQYRVEGGAVQQWMPAAT